MNIRISVLGFIIFVAFVLADESSSFIRIRNKSSDADINGVASWETQSKTEFSSSSTGKLHPGQNATLVIPSSKKKISLSLNSFQKSENIVPIVTQTLVGPTKRCYTVTGEKGIFTWNQETC